MCLIPRNEGGEASIYSGEERGAKTAKDGLILVEKQARMGLFWWSILEWRTRLHGAALEQFGAAWSGGAAAAHGGLQVESFGMCLHLFSAKADLQPLRDFYKIEKYYKNSEIFLKIY